MKIWPALFVLILISGMVRCQSDPKFTKVENSDVDKERLAIATDISRKILSAQKNGGYYALSEAEATSKMKSGLDESLQKRSYEQIKGAFGDFNDLTFEQMMKPVDGTLFEVYRFRGEFGPGAKVEVRTILNAEGKLTGFFVKPWKDDV